MPFTRSRGIRLERKKETSLLNGLKRPFAVKRVRVPLYEGPDAGPAVCVKAGDRVQPGQKIAAAQGPDGVPFYAGISGTVTKIAPVLLPDGRECPAVEIAGDGAPGQAQLPETKKDVEGLSSEELLDIFREQGLLATDEKTEPVHARVRRLRSAHDSEQGSPILRRPVRTVVINGCEPEPYVTSEQVLLGSHPVEVLKGAELLRKASGAEKIVFVIEDANREEFELIKSKIYFLKWDFCDARMVPAVYPAGRGDLLLKMFPEGAAAWNASTAYAAYEAVYLQKPFFERVVTVGGECVVEPRNLWLPLGFLFEDAVQACKGFLRAPRKVLAGGPMTGTALSGLDLPVTAGTDAILALPAEVAKETAERPCIRCNRCVDICPVSISPALITIAAEQGEFGTAEEAGAGDCIECGVCGYVCPSQRPMTELIRSVKLSNRTKVF